MSDLMQQLRDSQLALLEVQTSLFAQQNEANYFHMPHLNPTQQYFDQQDVIAQAERLVEKIDDFAAYSIQIGEKVDAIMEQVQFRDFSQFQVAEEAEKLSEQPFEPRPPPASSQAPTDSSY